MLLKTLKNVYTLFTPSKRNQQITHSQYHKGGIITTLTPEITGSRTPEIILNWRSQILAINSNSHI